MSGYGPGCSSRQHTTHVVDPLPDRVRLVAAPGELRGRELEALRWENRDGVTTVICRMVDGAPGAVPACWTDLPEREPGEPAVGAVASLSGWRLLLERGERLRSRPRRRGASGENGGGDVGTARARGQRGGGRGAGVGVGDAPGGGPAVGDGGLQRAVIEDVRMGSEGEVIVSARPGWRERDRCGVCRRRSPGFDLGEGRRRWRALDLGTTFAFVEAEAPRVRCRRHGVVVCAVPWARHGSRFTRAFEDQVSWLAVNASKTAVAELMRVAWRTVGTILERVAAEAVREVDLLDGLTPDRDRRDQPPQGTALPHCRGRPSHQPAGVGGARPRPSDRPGVL